MRTLPLLSCLLLLLGFAGTAAAHKPAAGKPEALFAALRGTWVGVLEYRDYSEPPTSSKRVDLPTWLTISGEDAGTWHYVYDDGPSKVVTEDDVVRFDATSETYTQANNGKPADSFHISGLDGLQQGRGVLHLSGSGTDNGRPADLHLTMTVRRNLVEIEESARPAGSAEAYSFRHLYRMVRAEPPASR